MRMVDIEGIPPKKQRKVECVVTADMVAKQMRAILDRDAFGYAIINEVWEAIQPNLVEAYGENLRLDFTDNQFTRALSPNNLKLHDETGVLSLIDKGSRPKFSDARRIEYAMKNGVVFSKKFSTKANYRERMLDKMGV